MDARTFKDIIEEAGYETRAYSGRGMFGRDCLGVVPDNDSLMKAVGKILASAVDTGVAENDLEEYMTDFAATLQNACTDQMGRGIVIYWPDIPWIE